MGEYDKLALRVQTDYEAKVVSDTQRKFGQLTTQRNVFAAHWEEVAALIDPQSRNTFFYGNSNWQGAKKTEQQIDATGMMALKRFSAICDSLLTPRNMMWHGLQANDEKVAKDRNVRLYFEQTTRILFKNRYAPHANFSRQNQQIFRSLGAYGTGGMFGDEFDDTHYGKVGGIRYRAMPLGEIFITQNHQGLVDGFIRWFRLTARQAYQKWPDTFPATLIPALEQNSEMLYNFLHHVCPREDYDHGRLDAKGKPWASYYISLEGKSLLSEGGYFSFPAAVPRYEQSPGETYGRSVAMSVLPALKTLNAEKRTFLKAGHRAADPVLLVADDGILSVDLRPGAINKGGVTSDGKPLVHALQPGDIQISKEMMAEEKQLIDSAFLVSLFQVMQDHPNMTATQVIELVNEKGILLAPEVGGLQSDYLGPLIDRELDVLAMQGLLPPMPGLLREAGGEYEVIYTSPLAKAMRAQEASGFLRTLESTLTVVNATQDASLLDTFDFDVAVPEMADINGVPASWMASDEQVEAKRAARAKQQQAQQQVQAMPAQAAIMKAQAVAAKAGQPQG